MPGDGATGTDAGVEVVNGAPRGYASRLSRQQWRNGLRAAVGLWRF